MKNREGEEDDDDRVGVNKNKHFNTSQKIVLGPGDGRGLFNFHEFTSLSTLDFLIQSYAHLFKSAWLGKT